MQNQQLQEKVRNRTITMINKTITLILTLLIGLVIFNSPPATAQTTDTPIDQKTITPQQEQNRREFKAMLWSAIMLLIGMFILVFVLFIIRMARSARRHHLTKKRTQTEYIDAWSQYRLPDDLDSN
jgi:heme/copper-type cytochrome/quinol oxidase subunit 2